MVIESGRENGQGIETLNQRRREGEWYVLRVGYDFHS